MDVEGLGDAVKGSSNKDCDPLPPPYPLLLLVVEEVPLPPAEYLLLEW